MDLANESNHLILHPMFEENGQDVISDDERQVYEVVILVCVTFCIGMFGVFSNIVNIIIFYKHGFGNTVNIGLISLAVADLFSSLTVEWYCISFNPLLIRSGIKFFPTEVQHLTAAFPHSAFACITNWITVYIALERCLCITAPLKVKQILTPTRTVVIILFIYVLVAIPVLPEYATAYLGPKFFPEFNKTLVGLLFTEDRYKVEGVSILLYAVLTFISFLAVIVFTAILVISLRQKTRWRQKSTFDSAQSETISRRDKSAVKMVIAIACIFIINFSPTVALFCGVFIVPELSITGQYRNLFLVLAAFTFVTDALNASINIVTYYTMSSKYRQTLRQMFSICFHQEKMLFV